MIPIAIANGAARQLWYGPHLSELRAHQVSTLTALILFTAYMAALFAWRPTASLDQALAVGGLWFALTIAFEFLFGHYVGGQPWAHLLHDYDLRAGRLWVLIPLWLAIGPAVLHLM
jgi:hypothetical protein